MQLTCAFDAGAADGPSQRAGSHRPAGARLPDARRFERCSRQPLVIGSSVARYVIELPWLIVLLSRGALYIDYNGPAVILIAESTTP